MLPAVFPAHRGLDVCRRVPAVARADGLSALDIGTLFFLGLVAAALSTFVKLGLGIPGHNILRVVFPMALGLALVPRRGSATIMGLGGTLGAVAFPALGGSHIGLGAATGLTLLGLLLDVALLGARSGWSIYVRLAAAGRT